jgi:hypothetical protein
VDPAARAAQKEELKKFKAELTRLHFQLGTEGSTDYSTTTSMPPVDTKGSKRPPMKKDTHRTNFVLGDETVEYRSESMRMSGAAEMTLRQPYQPRIDNSWEKDLSKVTTAKRR